MKISEKFYEIINKKLKLIEIVLKLLCSDDEQIEENFYIMWPDGQENDLNVIKSLKIPRIQAPPHSNNDGYDGHNDINNITSNNHNVGNNGNTNNSNSGIGGIGGGSVNIFKDNKITHGIDNAVASIDNAMENFKLKATNFTDKLKIGKK